MRKFAILLFLILSILMLAGFFDSEAQTPSWTMRAGDMSRSGWQPNETILNQQSVGTVGLKALPRIPLMNDARGGEGQALVYSHGNSGILISASMANVVRGVNPITGTGIWQTVLTVNGKPATPITGSVQIDMHRINDKWGCMASGVIVGTNVYFDCWVSMDDSGSKGSGRYYLFTLDALTGKQLNAVLSQDDNGTWKKRSSLGYGTIGGRVTIFNGHGTVNETSSALTGGITFYDVAQQKMTLQYKASAGIWGSGEGLVMDELGNVYLMTGNGAFDPSKGWFGECILVGKYKYDGKTQATFTPTSWFTPWTDYWRAGQADPYLGIKLSGVNPLSEEVKPDPVNGGMQMDSKFSTFAVEQNPVTGEIVTRAYLNPVMAKGAYADQDLGSGGLVYIAALKQVCGGGKDGLLYCLHTDRSFGNFTLAQAQDHHANCKNLVGGGPVFATAYVGGVDACTDRAQDLNFLPNGGTDHMHGTPVVMYDPALKLWVLFIGGENQQLHEWALHPDAKPSYVAESNEYASADLRGTSPGGMTGWMCSGSGNGFGPAMDPNSALVVCTVPYGDANAPRGGGPTTPGRLLVYDAIHRDATGHLKLLWDTQRWGIGFTFNKFLPPTIWGGQIFMNDYSGSIWHFALTTQQYLNPVAKGAMADQDRGQVVWLTDGGHRFSHALR